MTPKPLTRDEQETIIRSSAADSEWDICTADPRIIRYLVKRGFKPSPDHQFSAPYQKFTVPFKKLRFSKAVSSRPTGKPFPKRETAQQNDRSPVEAA